MSYENAPATKLVATHCLCCRRALVDAKSLAIGVGPDCADKYGFFAEVPEAVRVEANAIIYRLAADPKADTIEKDLGRLATLGFQHIVEKVASKLVKVVIVETVGGLTLKTPYSEKAVEAQRRIPGRRWNKEAKLNEFPTSSKPAVFEMLKSFFPGALAKGPKGIFAIPAITEAVVEAPAAPVARPDDYLVSLGLQDDGVSSVSAQDIMNAAAAQALPCGATSCDGGEGCDGEMMDQCPLMGVRPASRRRPLLLQGDFTAARGSFKRDVYAR